jgi:hypothetical protein
MVLHSRYRAHTRVDFAPLQPINGIYRNNGLVSELLLRPSALTAATHRSAACRFTSQTATDPRVFPSVFVCSLDCYFRANSTAIGKSHELDIAK